MTAQPKRRATILDVARLAGVSHQTVSRYLRNEGGLKEQTTERIRGAIAVLDYHPDLVARSMRTRRSNRIAVLLPEARNWVPLRMLAGAVDRARAAGYVTDIVGLGGDQAGRGEDLAGLVSSRQAAGVLSLTPLPHWGEGSVREIHGAPLVVTGSYDEHMHLTGGLADGAMAGDIIRHLAGLGHRRFAHIAGPAEWASARSRAEVYHRTISELGLVSVGTFPSDWSMRGGYEAAANIRRDSEATALFAANDQIAFGAMRRLRENGWRIPADISVFGWNNDEYALFSSPSLSTVEVDLEAVGAHAMQYLLSIVEGVDGPPAEIGLSTRLVLRESTAAPKS
jgi:LacI family transcriptional regulator